MNQKETARLILDFIHRAMMHHAMWFHEAAHQFGRDQAYRIMREAFDRSADIQINRLAKILGFKVEDGVPSTLAEMPEARLESLKEAVAVNWLVNDGVWFQAVESARGMFDAKRCNDSCWAQFSPFEAWSVKKFLGLPDHPGLEGLKKALDCRLYAFINIQSVTEETDSGFIFRMNDCRVQSARKRKGLDDYPCKSGGLVEYTAFAEAIDPRIRTECLGCPPDRHPEEWICSWRFSLLPPIAGK